MNFRRGQSPQSRVQSRYGRRYRITSAILAVALSACIDWNVDPNEIVAIEFPAPPLPAVVAGDTMRDATGHVAPLSANLIDASGALVTGQSVEFLSRDTTVKIDGNILVAGARSDGVARLLATGAGIQSIVRQIEVVPRPDSLVPQGAVDTLRLNLLGTVEDNTSTAIGAKVLTVTTAPAGTKPVRSWIVNFQLEYHGSVVPAGDTTRIWLVNDAGRPSSADTTDTQGLASRRVRYRVGTTVPPADSVVVTAMASYRGTSLAGAPVRRLLPIRPKS